MVLSSLINSTDSIVFIRVVFTFKDLSILIYDGTYLKLHYVNLWNYILIVSFCVYESIRYRQVERLVWMWNYNLYNSIVNTETKDII